MTIERENDGEQTIIKLAGRLDTTTAPELETALKNLESIKKLILDFNDLEYVSSAGLRVLLATQKRMSKQGEMIIKNVNSIVKEVFEVTGFVDILNLK